MWLKLNLNGMEIELQIKGYQPSNCENWDNQWCNVDFSFKFHNSINYSGTGEIMLSCEVEELERKIDDFINDRIPKREIFELIEPDFVFDFKPSYNLVEFGECLYASPGHEMSVPIMEWKVNLWNGGLTDNYFSTTFDKNDLTILRDYLKLIIGKFDKSDDEITAYFSAGVIYGQF